jgi:hypothetical protein
MSIEVIQSFQHFFDCCVGHWQSERTYHYLAQSLVERSHTEFTIHPLSLLAKQAVLRDNDYGTVDHLEGCPGYHLAFDTVSERGDQVAHALNFLFVYREDGAGGLIGDYLRDRAYEEAKPMVSAFEFFPDQNQLRMKTFYTQVVSIDTITLVNPTLRLRTILNYRRPPGTDPLTEVALAGFGVEQKK